MTERSESRLAVGSFEFKLVALDRIELRKQDSQELRRLNEAGAEGWRIVHIKEDPQNNRDLLFFLERAQD